MRMKGKVVLVGAGPGDPGLLTIKGREALLAADVVVYDRLVGEELLALIPEKAERIDVGKESGNHPTPQEEISGILLEKALSGNLVVRLKGGDPFLFGRGGEELELLRTENIPFEAVPGVTSALAVPCYGGIPVSHRDYCSSVHIITGHRKKDGALDMDFGAMASIGGTLIFLMSVATMGQILKGLKRAGMRADMPAAVIERGTLPGQRKILAEIGTMEEIAIKAGVKSPAILIVGEVCSLSSDFDWFSKLPLHGKTVLVTRPANRSGTLSGKLRALGARVIPYPCIMTESIHSNSRAENALARLWEFRWLALTSPVGVQTLFELLKSLKLDARALSPVKLAVIGSGTAVELEKFGLRADFVPEKFDAAHFAKGLSGLAGQNNKILVLRAEDGTAELTEILDKEGALYEDISIYRTNYKSDKSEGVRKMIRQGEIDFVTFTSASTVAGFANTMDGIEFSKITGVCIGTSTEKMAQKYGIKTITAKNASIDHMIDAIIREGADNGTH